MLSRMATRCRSAPTISSFEGVSDLFITLSRASRVPRNSRGGLKSGLLELFWARARRLIARSTHLPFILWSSKGSPFESQMPDGFVFPEPLRTTEVDNIEGVLRSAVRSLRTKARISDDLLQFLESNVPRASPEEEVCVTDTVRRLLRGKPIPPRLTLLKLHLQTCIFCVR